MLDFRRTCIFVAPTSVLRRFFEDARVRSKPQAIDATIKNRSPNRWKTARTDSDISSKNRTKEQTANRSNNLTEIDARRLENRDPRRPGETRMGNFERPNGPVARKNAARAPSDSRAHYFLPVERASAHEGAKRRPSEERTRAAPPRTGMRIYEWMI